MAVELRCNSKKHAEVIDDHTIEILCRSKFCGYVAGKIVVIHRFDILTQELKTRQFKEIGDPDGTFTPVWTS